MSARIAAVFANNGAGVRGNLKAVVRAILTDADARGDVKTGASDGKLKEPVLFMLSLARLIGGHDRRLCLHHARRRAWASRRSARRRCSTSIRPTIRCRSANGLLSPPTKLMTTSTILARHNFAYDWNFTATPVRMGGPGDDHRRDGDGAELDRVGGDHRRQRARRPDRPADARTRR